MQYLLAVICILFLASYSLTLAQDTKKARDDAKAIEQDSKNAKDDAEKGNYGGAREKAGKGFDDYSTPYEGNNDYDIPEPGEPEIDNE